MNSTPAAPDALLVDADDEPPSPPGDEPPLPTPIVALAEARLALTGALRDRLVILRPPDGRRAPLSLMRCDAAHSRRSDAAGRRRPSDLFRIHHFHFSSTLLVSRVEFATKAHHPRNES